MKRGPIPILIYGIAGPVLNIMADKTTKALQHYYENYKRNSYALNHQTSILNTEEKTVQHAERKGSSHR